jgi:ketosteroid isomerase-like protein
MHKPRRPLVARSIAAVPRIVLACLALGVAGCNRADPERELRQAIVEMAQSIEARAPAKCLDHLADDFTRESETFGKRDVQRMLAGVLLRNEKISVTTVVNAVVVTGDTARTKVRVIATGGSGLLPERGQTWEFDAAWRREKGTWRVYNAEWREGL